MTEHHHFQIMLHQIEQAQRASPAEARRRANLGRAQQEGRVARTGSLQNLISGMKSRLQPGSSAPCPDASAPC